MSSEPSSPSTDITNTDHFESVSYSDIVEGSIYYENEMEIEPTTYHNKRRPVPLDAFQQRYIHAFNRYPSREDFRFQNEIINKQLTADGLPPRPSSPLAMIQELKTTPATREPSPTLRPPATPPSLALKTNCPKITPKRAKLKLQSPINPGYSRKKDLKEHLRMKIRNIQDKRTQKLSPLQAGQLASELAQDLLELATIQASLQEEYIYMLELSLSASGSE